MAVIVSKGSQYRGFLSEMLRARQSLDNSEFANVNCSCLFKYLMFKKKNQARPSMPMKLLNLLQSRDVAQ